MHTSSNDYMKRASTTKILMDIIVGTILLAVDVTRKFLVRMVTSVALNVRVKGTFLSLG